jgi:hypothetical protein
MSAKPAAERMAALRQRRQAEGLTRLELWAHPDDWVAIKALAAKVQKRREKAAKVVAANDSNERPAVAGPLD